MHGREVFLSCSPLAILKFEEPNHWTKNKRTVPENVHHLKQA
jgi:hypothetical protein